MVFKSRNESPVASDPSVRRYHVVGVDTRCEALFHSMMRLVAGKAESRWVHDAESHDLIVHGPQAGQAGRGGALRRSFASFVSGRGDDCAMLRLDGMVATLRTVEKELAVAAPEREATSSASTAPAKALKLTRWPHARLLAGHPAFPKLATLLLARPMTTDELVRHSGLDEATCAGFLDSLREAGVVEASRPAASVDTPRRGGRGLFAMIRERLGLGEALS